MQIDAAHSYIRAIRKPSKKGYAEHYWHWLVNRSTIDTLKPEPDWKESNLSYMTAQAVRMRLQEFTK